MNTLYDTIGINYSELRRPDPRIATVIYSALGSAETVLNVGAGTGSYEPAGKSVTAVEPSTEMIRQRPAGSAPVVQASAENLPFDDNVFEASMTILSVHHWTDKERGLKEMRRVTRGRVVVMTFDPSLPYFWLADYISELVEIDHPQMPRLGDFEAWLGPVESITIPIPHDCTDGFMCAYWRRPEAYLDPKVRSAISSFSKLKDIAEPMRKLARDLETGDWRRRYGELLDLDEYDCNYRLVVAS